MTTKFQGFLEKGVFVLCLAFAVILTVRADSSNMVLDGVSLWVATVLPSTFPYLFITAILSSLKTTQKISLKLSPFTRRVFNVNGLCGYAFIMSVISGYPVGAQIVSDLKNGGLLTDSESTRASAFCSTSSPVFLIGCVGNIMFGNSLFGLLLFLCNFISAFLNGIIFSFYKRKDKAQNITAPLSTTAYDDVIGDCAYNSALSIIKVGSIITLFYLFTEILSKLGVFTYPVKLLSLIFKDGAVAEGLILGAFECTKGLKILSAGGLTPYSLPICAFICGFGGLSVIIQSLACLKKAKIKTAPFILAKIIMAVTSVLIALLFNFFLL
ncbi:MAG: hypothetical protein IJZ73_00825 [Clostridia bacterium]|nr:hypothetical protein [Clostridia bacterium]